MSSGGERVVRIGVCIGFGGEGAAGDHIHSVGAHQLLQLDFIHTFRHIVIQVIQKVFAAMVDKTIHFPQFSGREGRAGYRPDPLPVIISGVKHILRDHWMSTGRIASVPEFTKVFDQNLFDELRVGNR